MKKLLLTLVVLLSLGLQLAMGQSRPVKGQVLDDKGEGVPGASVQVKGTKTGTITDADGNFSLDVPDDNDVLVINAVGFSAKEVAAGDGDKTINVSLATSNQTLDETVVTALGIKRQVKSLSYTTQEVKGDQLTTANNPNTQNALQGKVAGLTVKQTSGMPGSSTLLTLRGSRSFDGNNEPLVVVDGVPIESGTEFVDPITQDRVGASDGTSRLSDINPNDIESINVLKGPQAAALYGLRASNGVIIITTKKAKAGDGQKGVYNVEFYSNLSIDKATRLPELQSTYAQGSQGQLVQGTSLAFGPRIDTMKPYDVTPGGAPVLRKGQVPQVYDNLSPLFNTGLTSNTGAAFSVGGNAGSMRASVGYTSQKGILQGSDLKRVTAGLSGDLKVGEKLVVSASANYSDVGVNKLASGSNLSNPLLSGYFAPPNYDMWGLPYQDETNTSIQYNYRSGFDNPRWSLEHNKLFERSNRLYGNVNLYYPITDWLSANYRLGLDYYSINGKEFYDIGSGNTGGRATFSGGEVVGAPSGGQLKDYNIIQNQINSNFNLTFDKKFNDFGVTVIVGNETYDIRNTFRKTTGNGLLIPGFQNMSGASSIFAEETLNRRRVIGNYANLNLAWKSALYLNASLRNDLVSFLPEKKRSFTYPSVGLSFVPTELMNINQAALTYLKLRASWAQVGQGGPNYVQRQTYVKGGSSSGFLTDGFTFPQNGLVGYANSATLIDKNLKPQNTNSTELGFDVAFWNNRIALNYTFFVSTSIDQIFRVPLAPSSGYVDYLTNGGNMRSYGHEATLRITPVQTKSFRWDFTSNFTNYRNKVLELAPGVENIYLGGFDIPNVRAQAGNFYPVIFGTGYLRDPATNKIVVDDDPNSPYYGMPISDPTTKVIGNVAPDFEFSFQNTFTYKGLSLFVQVDWRKGGQMYSGNTRLGRLYGMLKETEDRTTDYIFPDAVAGHLDAEGNTVVTGANNIGFKRDETYWNAAISALDEAHVFSTTFVRLREVSLSYDFPSNWMKGQKIVKKISLNAYGRNLWLSTKYPNFDPEANTGGAVNGQGIEYIALPQVRSFGFGLRAIF